ncbi:MAG: hypothetical protein OEW92_11785 [Gammaproteobacteria bacterium]|jgi:hypothetical protein|nr:hypothetical protein [Gammaproteobacteria bacterium]MDH5173092.1 hypothetical protein [Gammaproteobacteria bacterium]
MSNEFLAGVKYPHPFDELAVELCGSAAREVCILSPALDPEAFDSIELVDALGVLIRSSRQTRVRILVADTRGMVSRGHRLLQLARRIPSSVQIRKLAEHPQWKSETIVICDRDGVLYKPGDSDHDGFYEPSSRASTQRHLDLFEELWRNGSEDVELRTLSI